MLVVIVVLGMSVLHRVVVVVGGRLVVGVMWRLWLSVLVVGVVVESPLVTAASPIQCMGRLVSRNLLYLGVVLIPVGSRRRRRRVVVRWVVVRRRSRRWASPIRRCSG